REAGPEIRLYEGRPLEAEADLDQVRRRVKLRQPGLEGGDGLPRLALLLLEGAPDDGVEEVRERRGRGRVDETALPREGHRLGRALQRGSTAAAMPALTGRQGGGKTGVARLPLQRMAGD